MTKQPFGVSPPPEHWVTEARRLAPTLVVHPVTVDKLAGAASLLYALADEVDRLCIVADLDSTRAAEIAWLKEQLSRHVK